MCIAAWLWQAHPLYPLILVHNRDEFHDRPTKPVAWWGEGEQKILGGRDEVAGGTWMGCTKDGRLSFVTNVLEPDVLPTARTRGELPVRFLQSRKNPLEFAEEIVKEADEYNGFNLIVADLCSKIMVCISNRPKEEPVSVQLVSPGLHVLSNAKLDTPWHKAQRLRKNFRKLLQKHGEEEIPAKEMVEKLMQDTSKADQDRLPNTGCDPEWELKLSSIFVDFDTKLGRYGTRSTAALSVKTNGDVSFYDKYLESRQWKEHTVEYHIERMK
ncbi:transport and Golgi organization 2 homolog [Phoenix dactylifera]|uniref:Transport and Golgi organization 2 homolog n=1 Tax=Phoenix dactylifera TaxID=42345 RepID=A0A8B7BM13_PHODC|nr:transport and Golgi organization 2 homolog [Phoenix dactylifera]